MAITGEKFLSLNRTSCLRYSRHAKERLDEILGYRYADRDMEALFSGARQIKSSEMVMLGYRPDYDGRKSRGIDSWYFRAEVGGTEVVIVVGYCKIYERLIWVTTLGRSRQTDAYAVADYSMLRR